MLKKIFVEVVVRGILKTQTEYSCFTRKVFTLSSVMDNELNTSHNRYFLNI